MRINSNTGFEQAEHHGADEFARCGSSRDKSAVAAALAYHRRGKHSVKPVEAYEYIEAMFPAPAKLELFARNARPGWVVWGNESESGPSEPKTYDEVRAS